MRISLRYPGTYVIGASIIPALLLRKTGYNRTYSHKYNYILSSVSVKNDALLFKLFVSLFRGFKATHRGPIHTPVNAAAVAIPSSMQPNLPSSRTKNAHMQQHVHTHTQSRTHAHTYPCTHIYKHARTHAHTSMQARMHARTHTLTYTRTYTQARAHARTHTPACTRAHARTRAQARTCTHARTHPPTRKPTQTPTHKHTYTLPIQFLCLATTLPTPTFWPFCLERLKRYTPFWLEHPA